MVYFKVVLKSVSCGRESKYSGLYGTDVCIL